MKRGYTAGMRRLLPVLATLVGGAVLAQSPAPSRAPAAGATSRPGLAIPPVGARTGRQVFDAECAQCHGANGDGDGPGRLYLPARPRDFTRKKFKLRSTAAGALPTRADLFDTITRGIKTHGMPAFDFLPEAERHAVVEQVLAFAGAEGKPDPATVPVPPLPDATPERLAQGKEVFDRVQCGKCHQAGADDPARPDLTDERGDPVHPPHLAQEEFIGPDGARDVLARLRTGMDGTPMPSFAGTVADDELAAAALWVKSVHQPLDFAGLLDQNADRAVRGKMLVERHHCRACHVINRQGADVGPSLDSSGGKLRTEWIRAWLRDPRAHGKIFNDRYYRMPNLHLSRRDVEDLAAFVLQLGNRSIHASAPFVPPPQEANLKSGEFLYRNFTCPRCHALGDLVPAAVPLPSGPDLMRTVERLDHPWLQGAIVSEGTTPPQAAQIRDWLWKVASERGPKPPPPPPPGR